MKTKELIALLQEADPTGELPVCVGNVSPYFVDVQPGYYDGCLQLLVEDPALKPYYSVVGGKICSGGMKVKIVTMDLDSAIFDNPDLPVEYDSPYAERHYKKAVEAWREQARESQTKLAEWAKENGLPTTREQLKGS